MLLKAFAGVNLCCMILTLGQDVMNNMYIISLVIYTCVCACVCQYTCICACVCQHTCVCACVCQHLCLRLYLSTHLCL